MNIFKKEKGIISLAAIFTLGFLSMAMALTSMLGGMMEFAKNRNTASGDSSFYTAEAAVKEGVYQFLNTTAYTNGALELINNVSEALISVTTSTFGVAHKEVIGAAKNNSTNRKAIYTVFLKDGLAFEYAIFSADDINLLGNASVEGNTFSNGNTTLDGVSKIDGDASAVGIITGNVNGLKNEGQNPIDFPEINIDFDKYKNDAQTGGTLFTNTNNLENYLKNKTSTGIIFASTTNPVAIQGPNTRLSGSLVTLGDLSINNGKFISTDNYMAIITAGDFSMQGGEIEGNVYIEGDFKMNVGKIKGIVYVKGGTTFGAGNWTIEGAIISAEGVQMTGSGGKGIVYDYNILADWFNFDGLTITSNLGIAGWKEE